MKVKELIDELCKVDDDIMEFEVWVTLQTQLTKDVRLTARAQILEVRENADIANKVLFISTIRQRS